MYTSMKYDYKYDSAHKWLKYHFGIVKSCDKCGSSKNQRYEYALKHGFGYEKIRDSYIELCSKCHKIYDGIIPMMTVRKLRPVCAYKDDGYMRFDSIKQATEELSILKTSISNALKGKSLTAGGYKWRYA